MSSKSKQKTGIPSGSILSGNNWILETCPLSNHVMDFVIKSVKQ
jgi:hypothetical protein